MPREHEQLVRGSLREFIILCFWIMLTASNTEQFTYDIVQHSLLIYYFLIDATNFAPLKTGKLISNQACLLQL